MQAIQLPAPPAPTALVQRMADTDPVFIHKIDNPNRTTQTQPNDDTIVINEYINCSIEVTGYWKLIAQANATADQTFSDAVTYTRGTTTTQTASATFSTTLNTGKDLPSIAATLSGTIGRSVAFSESQTHQHTFQFAPKGPGEYNMCRWQPVLTFKLTGQLREIVKKRVYLNEPRHPPEFAPDIIRTNNFEVASDNTQPLLQVIVQNEDYFVPTAFPQPASETVKIDGKEIGAIAGRKYTLP